MITVAQALEPVRTALTGHAARDARRIAADAQNSAAHMVSAAEAQAKEILDEARARGEADARLLLADERAAARRAARATVLRAQRQIYERLRHQVRESIVDVRDSPGLRAALTSHALLVLGPATVTHDDPCGGIVARAPGRYLDYSLTALADRAFDRIAPRLAELWAP